MKPLTEQETVWAMHMAEWQLEETARVEEQERRVDEIMKIQGGTRQEATWAMHLEEWKIEENSCLRRGLR